MVYLLLFFVISYHAYPLTNCNYIFFNFGLIIDYHIVNEWISTLGLMLQTIYNLLISIAVLTALSFSFPFLSFVQSKYLLDELS